MEDRFSAQLKEHNYSLTRQRQVVFAALAEGAMTTKQLIAKVPEVDAASVYRIVHIFKRAGIATEVVIGGRSMIELDERFDRHHHHAACTRCGKSVSFEEPRLEAALGVLAKRYGLSEARHSIEISGICRACSTIG